MLKIITLLANNVFNRICVVLAELSLKNKGLAEKLDKNQPTISLCHNNFRQPSLETLKEIAEVLEVDVRTLIYSPKSEKAS